MPIAPHSDLATLLRPMEAYRQLHQDDPEETRDPPMVNRD